MNIANNNVSPFRSFWMAGFECSDKLNRYGERVDLIKVTGHDELLDQDYTNLSRFNITTVREGIRWSKVEYLPYHYDWSWPEKIIHAARRHNIQVLWDLSHFGFPTDLTPLHPKFASRFAALCKAFIQFYRQLEPHGELIITPINEVSFLSWLGGQVGGTSPYCTGKGWDVKYMLMKAYIQGIQALKEEDPSVKILSSEPLVNMVPSDPLDENQVIFAAKEHDYQYQVVDILTGRMCPELGGRPEYLDIAGWNYYYNNQWILGTGNCLCWKNDRLDARWKSLTTLLSQACVRSGSPVILSETGHPREDRPLWLDYVAIECHEAISIGVPFFGICLYPFIDRPDWDDLTTWHQSGIWDIADPKQLKRELYEPAAAALLKAQASFFKFFEQAPAPLYNAC